MILPPIFLTIIVMPHDYWGEAKTKFPLPSYPKEDAFEDSTKYEAAVNWFSMDCQWVLAEHLTWVDPLTYQSDVYCPGHWPWHLWWCLPCLWVAECDLHFYPVYAWVVLGESVIAQYH